MLHRLLLLAALAAALPLQKRSPIPDNISAELFVAADRDGNGKLDFDEYIRVDQKYIQARLKEFAALDGDSDNALSVTEFLSPTRPILFPEVTKRLVEMGNDKIQANIEQAEENQKTPEELQELLQKQEEEDAVMIQRLTPRGIPVIVDNIQLDHPVATASMEELPFPVITGERNVGAHFGEDETARKKPHTLEETEAELLRIDDDHSSSASIELDDDEEDEDDWSDSTGSYYSHEEEEPGIDWVGDSSESERDSKDISIEATFSPETSDSIIDESFPVPEGEKEKPPLPVVSGYSLSRAFTEYDDDKDGKFNAIEFLTFIQDHMEMAVRRSIGTIIGRYDDDVDGLIDVYELERFVKERPVDLVESLLGGEDYEYENTDSAEGPARYGFSAQEMELKDAHFIDQTDKELVFSEKKR